MQRGRKRLDKQEGEAGERRVEEKRRQGNIQREKKSVRKRGGRAEGEQEAMASLRHNNKEEIHQFQLSKEPRHTTRAKYTDTRLHILIYTHLYGAWSIWQTFFCDNQICWKSANESAVLLAGDSTPPFYTNK